MTFDWLQFTILASGGFAVWAVADLFLRSFAGTRLRSWWYQQKKSRFQYRLEGRSRAGKDCYFEELRTIQANAPCPPNFDDVAFKDWRNGAALSLLLAFINALDVHIS